MKEGKGDDTPSPEQTAILRATSQADLFPEAAEIVKHELNVAKHADIIFCSPRSKRIAEPRIRKSSDGAELLVVTPGTYVTQADGEINVESRTPTVTSAQIYFALTQLWYERGMRRDGYVIFSGNDVFKILNIKAGKAAYTRLRRELSILKSSTLHWSLSFTSRGVEERTTEEISLLSYNKRREPRIATSATNFEDRFLVQISDLIVRGMIDGHSKIFQQKEYLRISGESYDAAILYSKLDIYLSRKRHWRRNVSGLLSDIGIDGSRYSKPSRRKEKVEDLKRILDGAKLSVGRVKITISKGTKDLLFSAQRVASREPRDWNAPNPHLEALGPDGVEYVVSEMVKWVGFDNSKNDDGTPNLVSRYAMTYPESVIFDTLSRFRSDAMDDPKVKSKIRVFTAYLHREVHRKGLRWVGKCEGKQCKYQKDLLA